MASPYFEQVFQLKFTAKQLGTNSLSKFARVLTS